MVSTSNPVPVEKSRTSNGIPGVPLVITMVDAVGLAVTPLSTSKLI